MRDITDALRTYRDAANGMAELQKILNSPGFLAELDAGRRAVAEVGKLASSPQFLEQLAAHQRAVTEAADLIRRNQDAIAAAIRAVPLAVQIASEQANAVRAAIDRIGVLYRSPDFTQAARAALRNLNVAVGMVASSDVPELQVSDEMSSALDEIASANSAAERDVKVSTLVRALIEGLLGVDFRADSAEQKARRIGKIIALLFAVILFIADNFEKKELKADLKETKSELREQKRSIALLTETVAQLRAELDDRVLPTYRIRQEVRLRAAPNSSAPLVARLKPGQLVRLRATDERWRFVEVVTPTGERTGVSGWVYQRALRFEK